MKYYSTVTKNFYDDEQACLEAEKTELQKREDAKAAQAKKDAVRKNAAAKVDAARKAMLEAQKNYKNVLEDFCKEYGSYHYSVNSDDDFPWLFDWFKLL